MMELDRAIHLLKSIVEEQETLKNDYIRFGYTGMASFCSTKIKAIKTVLKEVEKNGTELL